MIVHVSFLDRLLAVVALDHALVALGGMVEVLVLALIDHSTTLRAQHVRALTFRYVRL